MTYSFRKTIITRKIHFSLESPEHSHYSGELGCGWELVSNCPLLSLHVTNYYEDRLLTHTSISSVRYYVLEFILFYDLNTKPMICIKSCIVQLFSYGKFCQWAIVRQFWMCRSCTIVLYRHFYFSILLRKVANICGHFVVI